MGRAKTEPHLCQIWRDVSDHGLETSQQRNERKGGEDAGSHFLRRTWEEEEGKEGTSAKALECRAYSRPHHRGKRYECKERPKL